MTTSQVQSSCNFAANTSSSTLVHQGGQATLTICLIGVFELMIWSASKGCTAQKHTFRICVWQIWLWTGQARQVRAGHGRSGQGTAGQGRAGPVWTGQGRASMDRTGLGSKHRGRAEQEPPETVQLVRPQQTQRMVSWPIQYLRLH